MTVALIPSPHANRDLFTATLANVSEVAARGGEIIGFGPDDLDEADLLSFSDYQPLPYHALHLNREIDEPRNLPKSVTVRWGVE
ncbi:hypothetical protein OHA25_58780 [Nonomuraea sp. NBC_00507]|uniref:hypothetical protein n=1 Tax=Nonomuraea sp. NBC_00507 TaxID=2976002 RepID=UPI002E177454